MKDFRDRVAVITGAGSGIGRALADVLTDAGVGGLALVDVAQERLREAGARARRSRAYVDPPRRRLRSRGDAGVARAGDRRASTRRHPHEQRRGRGGRRARGAEPRGLRVDRRHQLLGRGLRLQVLPAPPAAQRRRVHRQPVEHVRAHRHPGAVVVLRHEVRGAWVQRGNRSRAVEQRDPGDERASGWHPHQHRPRRPLRAAHAVHAREDRALLRDPHDAGGEVRGADRRGDAAGAIATARHARGAPHRRREAAVPALAAAVDRQDQRADRSAVADARLSARPSRRCARTRRCRSAPVASRSTRWARGSRDRAARAARSAPARRARGRSPGRRRSSRPRAP